MAELQRECAGDADRRICVSFFGGFVPWDDDLDICMLREDYIRFREVADAELPGEYVIHDYGRQEDHWLMLARVWKRE